MLEVNRNEKKKGSTQLTEWKWNYRRRRRRRRWHQTMEGVDVCIFWNFWWISEHKCSQIEFDELQINEIEINFCYVLGRMCVLLIVSIKGSYVSAEIYHSLCSTAFKRFYRSVYVCTLSAHDQFSHTFSTTRKSIEWKMVYRMRVKWHIGNSMSNLRKPKFRIDKWSCLKPYR